MKKFLVLAASVVVGTVLTLAIFKVAILMGNDESSFALLGLLALWYLACNAVFQAIRYIWRDSFRKEGPWT